MASTTYNNMSFEPTFSLGEPALPLHSSETDQDMGDLMGSSEDIWRPYNKYDITMTNEFRLAHTKTTDVMLPSCILQGSNNVVVNNNFEGVLEADESSVASGVQDDTDSELSSDIEYSQDLDDDMLEAASLEDDDEEFRDWAKTEFEPTTTVNNNQSWQNNCIHQEEIDCDAIPIISDKIIAQTSDRSDSDVRGRPTFPETDCSEERFIVFKSQKAKPGLPGAGLLQENLRESEQSYWYSPSERHHGMVMHGSVGVVLPEQYQSVSKTGNNNNQNSF